MTSAPDFTVVTPSRNYGRFIGDCLASVAAQEGVTVEHRVIDAGSTDETAEVVARFPQAVFVQEPDRGMSDGINKGFRAATGGWVMWLNADDRLKPGALAAVKAFAAGHPDADVIYGGWDFVGEDGGFEKRMTVFPFQRRMLSHLGCYIGSTACFFRRATTAGEGHLLDEDFRYVMDGEYLNRLAAAGKRFAYLPRVLAEFRRHGGNLSLRHRPGGDASAWLKLECQWAESRAIRRAYGWTIFKNEHLNAVVDAALYYFFLGRKALLKRWHAGRGLDA
jgi:glycosyltransferase involved in cell wall biosynthesis